MHIVSGLRGGRRIATSKRTTKVRVVASSGLGRVERKYPWNSFFFTLSCPNISSYDSMPDLGEIRVYQRADFQSGSRVLKKVF